MSEAQLQFYRRPGRNMYTRVTVVPPCIVVCQARFVRNLLLISRIKFCVVSTITFKPIYIAIQRDNDPNI